MLYGVLLVGSTIHGLQAKHPWIKRTRINPDKRAEIPKLQAHPPTSPPAPYVDPDRETSSPSIQSISVAKGLVREISLDLRWLIPPSEIQPFQPSPQTSDQDLDMTRAIS
ncbi:uncharacterized protein N7446_009700 [Penicillium canescens]|uniref:Uncharacterized protein n=1 Tax=Penicillium canescens TaxID=5083 RepID=A0AAD6N6D6_PENCN|nr:uncharacterized protein N7446_009700 [Penicillium canescens]KAJ6034943.1 hypothetical protein N7460_009118 [Penicillium canescens]KAJ6053688.1 hypothetical protein N7446_009700 [Penicillium canescens]